MVYSLQRFFVACAVANVLPQSAKRVTFFNRVEGAVARRRSSLHSTRKRLRPFPTARMTFSFISLAGSLAGYFDHCRPRQRCRARRHQAEVFQFVLKRGS